MADTWQIGIVSQAGVRFSSFAPISTLSNTQALGVVGRWYGSLIDINTPLMSSVAVSVQSH